MKKATFPQLVSWMFLIAVTFLIFMTALRFAFFFHFKPTGYSFSNSIGAFLLGLNFDLRIVCGIVLFPFLVGNLYLNYNVKNKLSIGSIAAVIFTLLIMVLLMVFMQKGHAPLFILLFIGTLFLLILIWLFATKNCNPFRNAASRKIFKTYFFIFSLALVIFYAVDFQHYDYLHQRLNATVLTYTEDASISTKMIIETYPIFWIFAYIILSTTLLAVLYNWYFKKITEKAYREHLVLKAAVRIIFTLLLGLGIFGRINQYPLRWSDAFTFNDDFKANLALNPVQSFLSSLEFKSSTYNEKKVRGYYPLIANYLDIKNQDSAHLNYTRQFIPTGSPTGYNVVVVICESFSAYKSSMWGNPLNTTPFFNQLTKDGVFFDRCFTPAYGTARGVWATITGIPDVEYPNTASRNPSYVDQHTIINDYKGYDKFYFIGGSSSWANIRGLLTNNIIGLNLYEEENFKAHTVDVWGISDKRLFLEANKVFATQQKPFFAVIQTADNHRPYTIPEEDRKEFMLETHSPDSLKKFGFDNNAELNAFRYSDFSFRKFIEAAQKETYFKNTIFVFVGDHGLRGSSGAMFPKAWESAGLGARHVPLLFYAPSILGPKRYSNTVSQLDLIPSVSALANISYTNTTMGKNLFDTTAQLPTHFKNARFTYEPNTREIGIVTDDYVYLLGTTDGKEQFISAKDNAPIPNNNETEEDKRLLKQLAQAYFETAKYMLYHNKKDPTK
jgi:phosphoglycerol transferase MdoB-like AlkP superfamily enzyme